jgi:hypothetical protein
MLVAFAVIGLFAAVLRWTFGGRGASDPPAVGDPDDFGLLTPVAVVETDAEAQRLRARLADAGIRATSTLGADGRHRVLVFSSELERARNVGGLSAP